MKYGISNFSLDILEYCDLNIIIKKEQYYIDLLKPEYNICKVAGSTIGIKVSEETKIKRSLRFKGSNNPMYGKTHTNEIKLLMSITRKGLNNPMYGKRHTKETKLKIRNSIIKTLQIRGRCKNYMLGKHHSDETKRKISESCKLYNKMTPESKLRLSLTSRGIIIKVFDNSKNLVMKFYSIRKAAEYFNVTIPFISKYINKNKRYKDFIFESEVKNNKIGIFDNKNKLIEILDNGMIISRLYSIPRTTVYRYIKNGKLFKNQYYLKKMDN